MPSNQEITNSTKTALLNAAINSLCSVGFTATTAVKICKSANVSRGSFHYHYPKGRTDIFMEIIHVTWQRVLKNQHNSAIPQAKRLMATFSEMEADEEFYKLMTAYNQIWQASELKFKDALVFVEAIQHYEGASLELLLKDVKEEDIEALIIKFTMLQTAIAGYLTMRNVRGQSQVLSAAMGETFKLIALSGL